MLFSQWHHQWGQNSSSDSSGYEQVMTFWTVIQNSPELVQALSHTLTLKTTSATLPLGTSSLQFRHSPRYLLLPFYHTSWVSGGFQWFHHFSPSLVFSFWFVDWDRETELAQPVSCIGLPRAPRSNPTWNGCSNGASTPSLGSLG